MFNNFHGFHLVEELHKSNLERAAKRLNSKFFKLLLAIAATLTIWLLPADSFGIANLTVVEQRIIGVFVFATLMWIMEAIPAWTTSLIAVVLLLFMVSTSALKPFVDGYEADQLGVILKYEDILHCFADPIIMLFIGGFILAIAATKYGLDATIARVLLKPFGTQSRFVMLGFIMVTGLFSMFVSNTATAAMMLAFLAPVLKALPADGKGKIGLALSIPVAANIGGMATPIGTPPNGIVLKYLNDPAGMNLNIGFGDWTAFMFPLTILLLFLSWIILLKMFPFKQKTINLEIPDNSQKSWRTTLVYITFFATILMWMFDKYLGVKTNAVAMFPVAVFCATGIIDRRDLEQINWSVLWMVAGGFALGVALNKSGLASHMIDAIPFNTWSPLLVIIGSGLVCYAMSNFISHTATAALLVPILAVVGLSMTNELAGVGGVSTLLIGVALCSSVAMVLPISTPPNALAHATGLIEQKSMMKVGLILGFISMAIGYVLLIFLGSNGMI